MEETLGTVTTMTSTYESGDSPGNDEVLFLGTLASELTVDTPLKEAFATAYTRYLQWRSSYLEGQISPEEFGELLADLRVRDNAGAIWTLGASTGRWYYRRQATGAWQPGPSPSTAGDLVDRHGTLLEPAAQASTPSEAPQPEMKQRNVTTAPHSVESLFEDVNPEVLDGESELDAEETILTFDEADDQ